MTAQGGASRGGPSLPWRLIGWGCAVMLLLLPLVLGAPWTLSDFAVAGVLLGGAGLLAELVVRSSDQPFYRAGTACAVLAALLLIWVNGAVGFLGNEDNPANMIFFGVIGVAVLGSVLAGFDARGMARAMFGAAAAQLLAGAVGLGAGWASPGDSGLYEVVMGTSVFGFLWLLSAGLFRKAAVERATTAS